jgi:hypothetical protein
MAQPEDLTGQILRLRQKGVLRAEALEKEIRGLCTPVPRTTPKDLFTTVLYGFLGIAFLGQGALVITLALL